MGQNKSDSIVIDSTADAIKHSLHQSNLKLVDEYITKNMVADNDTKRDTCENCHSIGCRDGCDKGCLEACKTGNR